MKYRIQTDPDSIISISDLRRNLSRYTQKSKKAPVVISDHGTPAMILMSIEEYEDLMDYVEGFKIKEEFEKYKYKASKWITEEELMKRLNDENIIR